MMKKAQKIGDTCNKTISQYNEIRCQMEALSKFNELEKGNEATQKMEVEILRIVQKEKEAKMLNFPNVPEL